MMHWLLVEWLGRAVVWALLLLLLLLLWAMQQGWG